jgi:hypothetical protein
MGRALIKRLFVILALLWPLGTSAQSVAVYGNWCGPNYPANPALAGPPVDALDAACMRHDICTANRGRFDCGCDLALMNELRTTRWQNPGIQSAARGIYDAIAVTPCTDPFGTAQKQSLFMQDAMTDVFNGGAAPVDIMSRWRWLLNGVRVK